MWESDLDGIFKRSLGLPCGKYSVGNKGFIIQMLSLHDSILIYSSVSSSRTPGGLDLYVENR